MRKLVLRSEGSFHQLYQSWLTKYRNKKETISLIQIFFLLLGIFACFLVFLIYVNKASTQGYFLRDANSTLNHITEQYETIKPKIMNLEEQNMNKLNSSEKYGPSITILDTKVETLMLPNISPQEEQQESDFIPETNDIITH
jgi:predicted PurR-regulated permease PerM